MQTNSGRKGEPQEYIEYIVNDNCKTVCQKSETYWNIFLMLGKGIEQIIVTIGGSTNKDVAADMARIAARAIEEYIR